MLHIVERIAKLGLDLPLSSDEGVGDVFQEDQAEHGMLVNGSVEIGAESVGGGPELIVEVAEKLLGVGGHAKKKSILLSRNGRAGKVKSVRIGSTTHRRKADEKLAQR